MEKPTFADLASAQQAQKEKKDQVKESKTKLTDYYKENGLKRNEDYSKDKTHGSKIEKLENRVEKRSKELEAINESVNSFVTGAAKGGKTKTKGAKKEAGEKKVSANLKYEYPADITTPDARKKYRIEQRKLASGGETKPKVTKEKKTKNTEAPEKATEEKTSKKVKKTTKEEPEAKKGKKLPGKKVGKKSKASEGDDND